MKIAFRISFLGQNFYGTQKLNNKRTIQGVFEEVLSNLYDQKIKVAICSRLDRKVNATDFVLSFIAPDERFDVAKLHYVVSRYLGKDIYVIGAFIVPDDFHPRGSCLSKTYKYSIQNGEINPLYNNFTFTPTRHIDEDRFIEALNLFKGKHDFRYFSSPEGDENTILRINNVYTNHKNGLFNVYIVGKKFLRYQIRFIIGACLNYCCNRITLDDIKKLLAGTNVNHPRLKAEPEGLCLEKVKYKCI